VCPCVSQPSIRARRQASGGRRRSWTTRPASCSITTWSRATRRTRRSSLRRSSGSSSALAASHGPPPAGRGYGQKRVEDALHDLRVRHVVIPRKGKPGRARQVGEHRPAFRKTVKWRTGSEGRISSLTRRHGWDRTRLAGTDRARIWTGQGSSPAAWSRSGPAARRCAPGEMWGLAVCRAFCGIISRCTPRAGRGTALSCATASTSRSWSPSP